MSEAANPVLVEVLRGSLVESRHRGAVAVCDRAGGLVAAWGDPGLPVFPRSALKPVQALPLIETGAHAAFGLGSEEIALAAASHSGEPFHVERVRAWLARIGLGEADLACGPQMPANAPAAEALLRSGARPGAIHNNCSGKHAGFLTVARHLGLPTEGYLAPDHPVQALVAAAIADMTGGRDAPFGIDGCGIPAYQVPLSGLAMAMARLADPEDLPPERRAAAGLVVRAMLEHPRLVAGGGRLCTVMMQAVPRIAVKGGAEGVYVAMIPERGLGLALKIEDGAGRASEVALLGALEALCLLEPEEMRLLAARARPPLLNAAATVVGGLQSVIEGAGRPIRSDRPHRNPAAGCADATGSDRRSPN